MFKRATPFDPEGSGESDKEYVEIEEIFETVDEQIAWAETVENIKLRDRLVWFCISSFAVEMFLVFLHAISVIVLPDAVITAISIHMGGSGFGLSSLLYYIARDLFRRR